MLRPNTRVSLARVEVEGELDRPGSASTMRSPVWQNSPMGPFDAWPIRPLAGCQQKALMFEKPVFMYVAPGATHTPHHMPSAWDDNHRSMFAHGWDTQRELSARQKEGGVIGPTTSRAGGTPTTPRLRDSHGRTQLPAQKKRRVRNSSLIGADVDGRRVRKLNLEGEVGGSQCRKIQASGVWAERCSPA
jgi:hypothetical protein